MSSFKERVAQAQQFTSITIRGSLDVPLYHGNYSRKDLNKDGIRKIFPSAPSTHIQIPPKIWIYQDIFRNAAQSHCEKLKSNARLDHPMPLWEDTFYFETEADFARATILYVLHPVNEIFNQALKSAFPCANLICKAEESDRASRFDFSWDIQAGNKTYKLAIFELKNTLAVYDREFRASHAVANNRKNQIWFADRREANPCSKVIPSAS